MNNPAQMARTTDIFVMDAEGSNPSRLSNTEGIQPSWSPSPRTEVSTQPVDGWVSKIVKLPPLYQLNGYFEGDD